MNDDTQLLRQYAREGSDQAFREVVERHIQLVYATARRVVAGDAHLAEDVTQVVFADLARKAAGLPENMPLGGWLHRHTCYTAAKAIRSENRRRNRERTAMEINAVNDNSGTDAHWLQLAPVLDDALNHLSHEDRDAVVMRYLQHRDVRSIGVALGTSENAVQKRLGRALEKLRGYLTHRGITLSTALLATTLDAGAQTAVPHGLAASVSLKAITAATAKTAFTLTTLKTMITTKLGLTVASIVVVGGIGAAIVILNNSAADSSAPAPAPAVATTPAIHVEAPVVAAIPSPAKSQTAPSIAMPTIIPTNAISQSAQDANDVTTSTIADTGAVVPAPSRRTVGVGGGSGNGVGSGSNGGTGGGGGMGSIGPGTVVISSGVGGGGSGSMPGDLSAQLGEPTSTTVNADGSTTSTYLGQNGQTIETNVSADGKSHGMKITAQNSSSSTTGGNPGSGGAVVNSSISIGGGFAGGSSASAPTVALPAPLGAPTATVNDDGSTTSTYTSPNGQTIETTIGADGKSQSMKILPPSPSTSN